MPGVCRSRHALAGGARRAAANLCQTVTPAGGRLEPGFVMIIAGVTQAESTLLVTESLTQEADLQVCRR
jgi:hypothetical protein